MSIEELIALITLLLGFIGAIHILLYEMLRDKITKDVQGTVTKLAQEERRISMAEMFVSLSFSSIESYFVAKKVEELCKECGDVKPALCKLHESIGSKTLLNRTLRVCKRGYLMVQDLELNESTGRVVLNATNNYLYGLTEVQERNLSGGEPSDPFIKTLAIELRKRLFSEIKAGDALQYAGVTEKELEGFEDTCLWASTVFFEGTERDAAVRDYKAFKEVHQNSEDLKFWSTTST
jgi:hypothetical protein